MSLPMQIELGESAVREIRELAAALHQTPQQTADAIVLNGMHMLRRYAFLKAKSETADTRQALEALRDMGRTG